MVPLKLIGTDSLFTGGAVASLSGAWFPSCHYEVTERAGVLLPVPKRSGGQAHALLPALGRSPYRAGQTPPCQAARHDRRDEWQESASGIWVDPLRPHGTQTLLPRGDGRAVATKACYPFFPVSAKLPVTLPRMLKGAGICTLHDQPCIYYAIANRFYSVPAFYPYRHKVSSAFRDLLWTDPKAMKCVYLFHHPFILINHRRIRHG